MYSNFSKQDKEAAHGILFHSIELKNLELLKDLLELGVNINIKNEVGRATEVRWVGLYNRLMLQDNATPLWLAIEEDCPLEMITLLMSPSLVGTRYKVE